MANPDAKPAADAGPISTGFLEDGRPRARSRIAPTTIAPLGYLTPQEEFGDVERGNPLPYTLRPSSGVRWGLSARLGGWRSWPTQPATRSWSGPSRSRQGRHSTSPGSCSSPSSTPCGTRRR